MNTPIALFVFNRPETTRRVLERIAGAGPRRLFVVADGPRPGRPEDAAKVAETRGLFERISWPCEVTREFSDENLGCRRRLISGINRVFDASEQAIFLEDDCLPDSSFFPYAEELLDRYRDDARIMMISGNNLQFGLNPCAESYYFSRFPHISGWATWSRAWKAFDDRMTSWPEFRDRRLLETIFRRRRAVAYWTRRLDRVHAGKVPQSWDYQWTYSIWASGGLAVLPSVNLVTNIGYGPDATHTRVKNRFAEIPTGEMKFPLAHPRFFAPFLAADETTQKQLFERNLVIRAYERLLREWSARQTGVPLPGPR
jgi:GT2 family glycosyltransferase